MEGIVDFHSHILPGIDDGSSSVEESLEMLRLSARQGVRHMVATPHFYPRYDDPEHFLRKREKAETELRRAMAGIPGLPDFTVGAEVYFFPGISDSELLNTLTIGKKECILIEMPPSPWEGSHYRELEGICTKRGLTPIVAHVDRYIRRFHTYGIPERLEKLPVLVQANASFFIQSSTRSMALRMLKKGQIHLLGSDCHNVDSRKPNLNAAVQVVEQRLGESAVNYLHHYQREVLPEVCAPVSQL